MTHTLTIIIAVLVGITTLAMLVQLGLYTAMFLMARRLQARAQQMAPRVQELAASSRAMMLENQQPAQEITAKAAEIGRVLKRQVHVLVDFGLDVQRGVRTEQQHAHLVVSDARQRVHETVELVGRGLTAPFRGAARGIQKAVHFFDRRAA